MKARLSPELLLVAACSTWPPGETRDRLIARRLKGPCDWQRVGDLAARHRVTGLVYDGLRRSPENVPAEFLQALSVAASRQMRISLQLAAEAHRIVASLNQAGIAAAVLKGAPLTMLAFGNLGLRHNRDNDLLIAPERVQQAAALIEAAGYVRTEPAAGWGPEELESWQRHRKHFEYFNADRNTRLELHWRLADNPELSRIPVSLNTPDTPDTLIQVPVAPGITLPTLAMQDLLLYLFLHGATHGWFRLKWLADVATLLAEASPRDRTLLIEQARRSGLERPALQAVELCRVLFEQSFPEAPRPGFATRLLVRSARKAIVSQEPDGSVRASLRIVLQRYLLRPTFAYRRAQFALDSSPRTDPSAVRAGWRYPAVRLQEWLRSRR